MLGPVSPPPPRGESRPDYEAILLTLRGLSADHLLVLSDIELEVLDDPTIILERLTPGRLVTDRDERHTPELEFLWCTEEGRIGRIAGDTTRDTTLVDDEAVETRLPSSYGDSEPTRACPDDEDIQLTLHV